VDTTIIVHCALTNRHPDPGIYLKKKVLTQSLFPKLEEDQTTTVEANLALLRQPIIGLELIQEIDSKSDDSWNYNCHLCSKASLTIYTIGSHVISEKHRKRYLQMKHPEIWNQLVAAGKNDNVACLRFAQEVEKEFGRQKIIRLGEEFCEKVPDLSSNIVEEPVLRKKRGFTCEVCQITADGETSYNAHLKGNKHKKKVASAKIKKDASEGNFNTLNDFMIGLEFIEEFQFTDELHKEMRYKCHICNVSTLTVVTISSHVVAIKHRRRYIKLKYPDLQLPDLDFRKSQQQVDG
jgi:hypothetical protein